MTQFADRLKSARTMAGFSLRELAERLENRVSRQAIHKYETGAIVPNSEMIGYLSNALGVRPDYFARKTQVNFENVEFRRSKKFPAKERKSLIEKTREFLSRYIELEEILGMDVTFRRPLSLQSISAKEDVENAAILLRAQWNLGVDPIFNLIELLESNQIKIVEVNTEDSIEGLSTWVNGSIPVIILNRGISRKKPLDRLRFTALHELGHLILPLQNLSERKKEKLCNYFAAAMLMPKEIVLKEIGKSRLKLLIPELGNLKLQYGISIQAMAYRLKDLNVISEAYFKQFMFMMDHLGYRIDEPFPYQGYEETNRFNQLLFRALGEEHISMSKAASLKNIKLAEFRTEYMLA